MRKPLAISFAAADWPPQFNLRFKDNRWIIDKPTLQTVMGFMYDLNKFGINYTIIKAKEPTLGYIIDNGTYNGLIGVIQAGRADVTLLPTRIHLAENPGIFTKPLGSSCNRIVTSLHQEGKKSASIFECLLIFDWKVVLTASVFVILLSLIFAKMSKMSSSLWKVYGTMQREYFVVFKNFKLLFCYLLLLLFTFTLTSLFGASFTTDVALDKRKATVDTLEDVLQRKYVPVFVENSNEHLDFELGVTEVNRQIWERVKTMGVKECVRTTDEMWEDYRIFVGPKRAAFLIDQITDGMMMQICVKDKNEVLKRLRLHTSDCYSDPLLGFLMRNNVPLDVHKRMDELAYGIIEFGQAKPYFDRISMEIVNYQMDYECLSVLVKLEEALNAEPQVRFEKIKVIINCMAVIFTLASILQLLQIYTRKPQ